MYRIFIVEDDAAIAGVIRRHLEGWGYTVRCVERFDDVLSEFAAFDPHLVLLDISLPFFNGYHWCQEIRRVSKAPILFLTSASDNVNVVMAMQLGGDDLLAKPFDLQVLSAKVQALLRRAYDFGPSSHLLSCGAAVLNVSDGTLDAHGQRVELTRNECRILQLLLEHKGEIVSRDALMTRLWESDSFVDENTLTVNIARLRRASRTSSAPGRAPDIWWRGDGMLTAYLKRQWKLLLLLAGAVAVFAAVFALYSLPVEAVAYAGLLCLMLGLVLFALGYSAFLRRHRELEGLLRKVHESVLPLPPPRGVLEADYQALLRAVCADRVRLAAENRDRLEDMTDYYTLWAHQIKTPIAAARLLLQEDPGTVGTEVEVELLKIEQYVDMVLGYLRLDSESTDYVLRDTDLDGLLRQAVRKFARMFILKKITLDFRETGRTVLTDGKWLSFVVEQVLSNALKYTPAGGRIRIYGDGETLVIADSGIGIRPEDLPRVFEKGFTGYNGREDKKSTGIGLYLCRRVMDRLNHGISIVSRPGQGTLVRLDLSRGRWVVE